MGKKTFGSVVHRADRGTFRAKYTYKGEVITKTFKDELSARAWLNSERSRVQADKAGIQQWTTPTERKRQEQATKRRSVLLCDYVEKEFAPTWLEYAEDGSKLANGTRRNKRKYLAHLSEAFFWKYPITEITTADLNRWLADMDNFGGATPRKRTFQTLKAVYAKAVNEGVVDRSPVTMKAPALPKSRQAEIPVATAAELQTIYEHMTPTTRISVWLGATLGLRIGEVVSLQVQDWNPETKTIYIRHSEDRDGHGLKDPKNAASKTTKTVPPRLAKLIEEACEGKQPTDFIVTAADGTHITSNRLRDHFDDARKAAGRPDLHFHTLRATSITAAVQGGATLKETMAYGRHSDAATSITRYQRASGSDRMREIAEGVEASLMGHEPTEAELLEAIAETKKRLAELQAQLKRVRHTHS
ncbi:tyrosine-type recombinase/integrase [Bifidobacterium angulatum]|uniref:tyrosine-type recombinase/integrase n=1 Tax=Bifidobacterium angulatum TaxID=1683 RepID=UPI0005F8A4D5|nr:site-specific integrase [Bifidobacterium angulatum]AMK57841.1 hypothetical protein Bang102_004785 [Bifidobacterium angulatum]